MATWLVGDRLSVANPDFAHALQARNPAMVEELVLQQVQCGVGGLLLDLGMESRGQAAALNWLLQVAQGAAVVPWVVRTADAEALSQLAARVRSPWTVDATAAPVQDWRSFLELARAHGAALVLPAAPGGQPADGPGRAHYVARQLLPWAWQSGIAVEKLFIDICPPSVARYQAHVPAAIEMMLLLRQALPQPPRLLVRLADVSEGAAPATRRPLQRAYLALVLAAGAGAVLLDPLDEPTRRVLRLIEQGDGSTPLGRMLLRVRQAAQEGRGLRPDEFHPGDPEQAAFGRAVSVLRGEAAYSEDYILGR